MQVHVILVLIILSVVAFAFQPGRTLSTRARLSSSSMNMIEITQGVEFDTIAREWRFKWSPDDEKASLALAQQTLKQFESEIKKVPGVKSVQRIVCGGCLDFKIITSLDTESFGSWEQKKFAPEQQFLDAVKGIAGITQIETQTFTLMDV